MTTKVLGPSPSIGKFEINDSFWRPFVAGPTDGAESQLLHISLTVAAHVPTQTAQIPIQHIIA